MPSKALRGPPNLSGTPVPSRPSKALGALHALSGPRYPPGVPGPTPDQLCAFQHPGPLGVLSQTRLRGRQGTFV
eukprot:12216582-Alexandrium_andersonii.AAC.1